MIDLNELERLLAEATPGPWAFDSYSTVQSAPRIQEYEFDESVEPDVCKVPRTGHGDLGTVQGAKDAELIVAAVNALPSLIRELRELRADRERLDWLERRAKLDRIGIEFEGGVSMPFGLREVGWFEDYSDISDAATLRAAIDAARVHAAEGGDLNVK